MQDDPRTDKLVTKTPVISAVSRRTFLIAVGATGTLSIVNAPSAAASKQSALTAGGSASGASSRQTRLAVQQYTHFGPGLVVENTSASGPVKLEDMTVVLSVPNSHGNWRATWAQEWPRRDDITIRAVVRADAADLYVNGIKQATLTKSLAPSGYPLLGAVDVPKNNFGDADYLLLQTSLTLKRPGLPDRTMRWASDEEVAPALLLFGEGVSKKMKFDDQPVEPPFELEATIRAIDPILLADLTPVIDRFGQAIDAQFPSKVRGDHVLSWDHVREQRWLSRHPLASNVDAYGGRTDLGFSQPATGYFSVGQHAGYWWMFSPQGNPVFYRGLDTVPNLNDMTTGITGRESLFAELPPKNQHFASAWRTKSPGGTTVDVVAFQASNMIRKYGTQWPQRAIDITRQRIASWGFSGAGKWANQDHGLPALENIATVGRLQLGSNYGVEPLYQGSGVRFDVFDPAIRSAVQNTLTTQISPRLTDPWVLGWSVGNENGFVPTDRDVKRMLHNQVSAEAKKALADVAIDDIYGGDIGALATAWGITAQTREDVYAAVPGNNSVPAGDREKLRVHYSTELVKFLYLTVKAIDPNHLYFGSWVQAADYSLRDDRLMKQWSIIAPYCDVLGYDRYGYRFTRGRLAEIMSTLSKPILCGEFGFPADYNGTRGFDTYGTYATDDAESAQFYDAFAREAAAYPLCVGVMWFSYRDEPITGRGNGGALVEGESSAFGLVDIADTPKWDLVEGVRSTNLALDEYRLQVSSGGQ